MSGGAHSPGNEFALGPRKWHVRIGASEHGQTQRQGVCNESNNGQEQTLDLFWSKLTKENCMVLLFADRPASAFRSPNTYMDLHH